MLPRIRFRRPLGRRARIAVIISSIFVGLMAVLAVTVALLIANLAGTFDSGVTKLSADEVFPKGAGRPASAAGAQNVLLLGSDKRGAVDRNHDAIDDQRSDTMMIVHIPTDRKNVQVMSIMRDSWVDIPGHGKAKINAALAYGGVPLVVQTVEQLTGARIDHVAMIDFAGFKDMTNALGGITVNVPIAFSEGNYSFTQGPNYMDGNAALTFVRARHPFADADFQRVKDQQAFLNAIANRAISAGTLTSPDRIFAFTSAVSNHLSVDSGFDFQKMMELGISLRDVRSSNLTFFTLPTSGTGMEGDQSVVYVNESKLPALKSAFADDTLGAFAAAQK